MLIDILDANKTSVKHMFNGINQIRENRPFESCGSCNDGVCFATYGEAANRARRQIEQGEPLPENPNVLRSPRCHSEFFLLWALVTEHNTSLVEEPAKVLLDEGIKIKIRNQQKCDSHVIYDKNCFLCQGYSPCKTVYSKEYYDKTSRKLVMECNPGIPCNDYIQDFANEYKCQIIVEYSTFFLPKIFKPND